MRSRSSSEISILRIIRILFLLSIAMIIVYLYRLYTDGTLLDHMLKIMTYSMEIIKKNPFILLGLVSYAAIFYWGYVVGKNRKSSR